MTDNTFDLDLIRRHCRPMRPLPTGALVKEAALPGIRAILFDVYGTLLISGSGDVGVAAAAPAQAMESALQAVGLAPQASPADCTSFLQELIRSQHAAAREQGVEYPEVVIEEIWTAFLIESARRQWLPPQVGGWDVRRLALEYELRANPVWPMPGAEDCLRRLQEQSVLLGIISNAQFFTPPLFTALWGRDLAGCGFTPSLCFFSFEHRQAKPGCYLYRLARHKLQLLGLAPEEVVYIGNDLLNDVLPAQSVGFRTALFAGDARSLRLRQDDARVQGVLPDVILKDLMRLPELIRPHP